ncbi:DUF4184 family protein [Brevibacillus formosus]|uniref:DUF4184 family protein n=1 Tax=Brevibacillus TaxID=55080 RepID=UPI000D1080F1|nr:MULTISPECIES: DUF4184 family protein [Brevibacillus]MBG9945225.1 hypothetical protein [Brevibacillus formosus]MED1943577.1 DUF4184 family protein [Brevibacillus formosus]MED2000051.1 DUF4184 family protein [Brevibacillus formosus]MED2081812.1 DUF4184 family protein [Brevibacillus formosus]PSK19242.1 DUF4184 domain-containing protein [Brevibacillus sp. NRRL NRS-603]
MPFTFSHPAIVLPLRKCKWFSFSALVFGSMAPDFEYFFRMQPYSLYSHTMLGLLLVDLPIAILLAFLYQYVVKKPMLARLPEWVGRGLNYKNNGSKISALRAAIVFVYSALIGSLSHIAWDAFTHDGGRMVDRFLFLQQSISIGHYQVPVYKLLQHGSTLFGGLAILYVIARSAQKNRQIVMRQVPVLEKWLFWFGVGLFGIVTVFLHAFLVKGISPLVHPLQQVVPFLSGSLLGIVVLCFTLDRLRLKK